MPPYSCRPIEKKSLDRFIPMYNVAVNLCTKMNDNRFTFILMLDRRHSIKTHRDETKAIKNNHGDYLSLYAVRTFIDVDAKRVKDMLDHAYFNVICRCRTKANQQHHDASSVNTYLDDYLLGEWRQTMHSGATLNHDDNRQALILPSIYCYVFDSSNYTDENFLSVYKNSPSLSDLMDERDEFKARVNNYMKTVNLAYEIEQIDNVACNNIKDDPDSEATWVKRLMEDDNSHDSRSTSSSQIDSPFGFEANFYMNPRDNDDRMEYELTMPNHQDNNTVLRGVDYDQFVKKCDPHRCQDNVKTSPSHHETLDTCHLQEWLDILRLCDSRLFSDARLQRDFPCSTITSARVSQARAIESVLCTLSIQHFCARNKINDIIRHVFITQNAKLYPSENTYLRNFSSYCEWKNYVDISRTLKLVSQISSNAILLEWLDNEISRRAIEKYAKSELLCTISIVPSHHSCSPSANYEEITDFNFHYFFTSCCHIDAGCLLPSNDFNAEQAAWCAAMRTHLHRNERLHIAAMRSRAPTKRSTLVSLSDIIPPEMVAKMSKPYPVATPCGATIDSSDAGGNNDANPMPDTDALSVRELLLIQAHRHKEKNIANVAKRVPIAADKWQFVVGQKVYGIPRLKRPLDYNDNPPDDAVADVDDVTLAEVSKIRIISYFQRNPRNTASVRKWLSRDEMDKKKKINAENPLHRLLLMVRSGLEENNPLDGNDPSCALSSRMSSASKNDKSSDLGSGNHLSHLPSISSIMNEFGERGKVRCQEKATEISSEQLLFLELFLTCSDAKHAILINGNPGTGKTTVMMHLVQQLHHLIICLLPTKVLRERIANTIHTIMQKKPSEKIKQSDSAIRPPVTRVMTFSAFVRRLMRYKLSPQVYSRIIERYLTEQQQRMCRTIRPAFLDAEFSPTDRPFSTIIYPYIAFIDEYNLIDWHQHFLIGEACEMLRVARVLYGDSGQSSPIRSTNDNAEMISLRCALTIQFLDNKRIIHSCDTLRELLSDQIWNWRSNNENENVCNYVRCLLDRHLHHLVNHRVTLPSLDEWFAAVSRLLDWYDRKPCRRHVWTMNDMGKLLNLTPMLHLPCIIALRNRACDRANYWIARAIRDEVIRRCHELETQDKDNQSLPPSQCRSRHVIDNYCILVRRNAYATPDAYEANADAIETMDQSSEYVHGTIADDPWCADLTLIIGAVYRFIGSSKLVERDSLLQLIAFLPESDNLQPSLYRCDNPSCKTCHRPPTTIKKHRAAHRMYTLGCGAPRKLEEFELGLLADANEEERDDNSPERYAPGAMPRLLMRRVYGESINKPTRYVDSDSYIHNDASHTTIPLEQDSDESVLRIGNSDNVTNLFIVSRSYYTLTRCSSVWTTQLYTLRNPREGMRLYGYPLVLNASVTSYRIQGETIADTDVYIDFERMGKEQALVALSRVRRFEQIRGVINIDKFGR